MTATPVPPAPKESFAFRIFGLLAEAFGWGVLGGIVLAVTAVGSNVIAERLYALNPSHSISGLIYGLLALIAGFLVSAGTRLARPRWTAGQMCIAIVVLAFLCGAGILQLDKVDASYEHMGR